MAHTEDLLIDTHKTKEFIYTRSESSPDVMQCMHDFFLSDLFTDVVIRYDRSDKGLRCHRSVLAIFSPYFKAVFQHQEDISHVDLCDLPAAAVEALVDFMYTGKLTIVSSEVIDILETAEFLQIREVVEVCSGILLEQVDNKTSLQLEHLGDSHLCRGLAEAAREHTLMNFSQVMKTPAFLNVEIDTLMQYIKDPRLTIDDENQFLSYLCNWSYHDLGQRTPEFTQLLSYIDFSKVEKTKIDELVTEYPILQDAVVALQGETTDTDISKWKHHLPMLVVVPDICRNPDGIFKTSNFSGDIYYLLHNKTEDVKWGVLTQLPFTRRSKFSVDVLNNCLYVCGGEADSYAGITNEVWMYSPDRDQWNKQPGMWYPRCSHGSTILHNQLYVVGGQTMSRQFLTDVEVFNPRNRQWTKVSSAVGPDLGIAQTSAVLSLGDKLYVFGALLVKNIDDLKGHGRLMNVARCYDTSTRTWKVPPNLVEYLNQGKFSVGPKDCLAYKGFILIIDDKPNGKKTQLYNPLTGTLVNFIPSHGQHKFGGFAIFDEKLYCCGGTCPGFSGNDMVHCHSLRQLASDNAPGWVKLPSLPMPLTHCSAHTLYKAFN